MMASRRESDNSSIIHSFKKMIFGWSLNSEEKGGEFKKPHTSWLTLGLGPWRKDGSKKDSYGKCKVMDAEKKGDSGSNGGFFNCLGSCKEDRSCKDIYCMDEAKDAEKKGEISSCKFTPIGMSCRQDGSKKQVVVLTDLIPEDILNMIFCKLTLHTLFQVQSVCTKWKTVISSSVYFHNLWEQNHRQKWLVMDQYDETSGSSNGLALFDMSTLLRLKKIYNAKWTWSCSQWFLRAGDGGLLVYSSKRYGILTVLNPLTMQYHCLEDAKLNRKSRISFYMRKFHHDVGVRLKFDSKDKTYQ
ncbi:hypothetical protein SUGI_0242670, partial [Cryptomeria japonica]